MRVAVLIPSHHQVPAGLLNWTLEGYNRQQLSPEHRLEVIVGIDGGRLGTAAAHGARVVPMERMGAAAVRNRLAGMVDADLLIFGNADARPDPDMVQHHLDAILKMPEQGRGCMVLGSAPWESPSTGPSVFDVLLAQTPMVFFYQGLCPGERYDFRHCWTLNLSVRADDFRACGGFHEELRPVYYEDLAFGWRLLRGRKGVLYEPRARVTHRHPTTLDQYLDREELLGLMAPVLARVCPEAFAAVYGTGDADVLAEQYRTWVAMDAGMHRWTYQRLLGWAGLPESVLPAGDGARQQFVETLYQMHVPLKRLAFRLGFLQGMMLSDDARWRDRVIRGEWRKIACG